MPLVDPQIDTMRVILWYNKFENILTEFLIKYLNLSNHSKASFIKKTVFNNSIMPMSSKIKLLLNIANEHKIKVRSHHLHEMLHMRNAFTHNQYDTIVISKDGAQIATESITGSGVLNTKPLREAYSLFFDAYEKSREIIDQIDKEIFND